MKSSESFLFFWGADRSSIGLSGWADFSRHCRLEAGVVLQVPRRLCSRVPCTRKHAQYHQYHSHDDDTMATTKTTTSSLLTHDSLLNCPFVTPPPRYNQDLKKQSIRLQNEKARQASDLALAIAVLEAVGVLPKEVREPRAACGVSELTTPQVALYSAAGSGSLRNQPTSNGLPTLSPYIDWLGC